MRILHVIDTLDGYGSARQLQCLVPALAPHGCEIDICCLRPATPQADELRRDGFCIHTLGWSRWFDAPALWALRTRALRGGYDLLHVWRLAALRAVACIAPQALSRAVVSSPWPRRGTWTWCDRQALKRVRCVVLAGDDERENWAQAGATALRCQVVPPAVSPALTCGPGEPRQVAYVGRLERGRGGREAIWAIDVLRYVFPEARLRIAGSGPRRPDLQAMIAGLNIVHARLLDEGSDRTAVLADAAVCWIPSRMNRGRQTALEAMAIGRVVVASDVPCLRELIRDDETGCLVPPGEPVALARRTCELFHDPAQAARLAAKAQAEVVERFCLDHVAARWAGLYHELSDFRSHAPARERTSGRAVSRRLAGFGNAPAASVPDGTQSFLTCVPTQERGNEE
jgi:glycosyltransferase involved in cell wall biosynthesis